MAGVCRAAGQPEVRAQGHRDFKLYRPASQFSLGLPTAPGGCAEPASLKSWGTVVGKQDGEGAWGTLIQTGCVLHSH